jgi:murein DD-endopeptidase MepM/ murein hydrolase activator NlpD
LKRYSYHLVLIGLTAAAVGLFRWNPLERLEARLEFPLLFSQLQSSATNGVGLPGILMTPGVEERMPVPPLTRHINPHTLIPRRPRQEVITYTVRSGDTLFGISEKYGITPETVLWGNPVLKDDPHLLSPGQELLISPITGVLRVVYKDDTIEGLAAAYQASADDILNWPGNHLDVDNPVLVEGTVIVVPGGERDFVQWTVPRITRAQRNPLPTGAGPGACAGGYSGGAVGSGSFIWPAVNHYLSGFGYSSYHAGIDIAAGQGAPIYAADSGVVMFAGWSNWGYGYMVVIDHGNGWQTLYAHLSQWNVSCGQSVYQGNVVGLSGSTGNSTGPHLHFEINYQGSRPNPWNYLP